MSVTNSIMVPHPPLIIPEIGHGQEKEIQKTIDAYRNACNFLKESDPDTIVITTPHSVMYTDWFHISPGEGANGDFSAFNAPDVCFDVKYDKAFADELSYLSERTKFPAGTKGERDPELDHATMIPLYFLKEAYGEKYIPPIVRIGLSGLPLSVHYKLGMMIRDVSDEIGRNISIVASGDLSHRLREDGPYGFQKEGPEYDKKLIDVMKRGDLKSLVGFSESLCDKAAECGHRSFTIMAGCFDGINVSSHVLSYEGPFGVGYGVCTFKPENVKEGEKYE